MQTQCLLLGHYQQGILRNKSVTNLYCFVWSVQQKSTIKTSTELPYTQETLPWMRTECPTWHLFTETPHPMSYVKLISSINIQVLHLRRF